VKWRVNLHSIEECLTNNFSSEFFLREMS